MAKRVNNILRGLPLYVMNPDLLVEKQEKELWSSFGAIRNQALPLVAAGDYVQAQGLVFELRNPLAALFDNVLVMAGDEKLRENRLALLQEISRLLQVMADFSQVVVEGEKKERIS
jgi:glycyl-tRNA synthetase beta chain